MADLGPPLARVLTLALGDAGSPEVVLIFARPPEKIPGLSSGWSVSLPHRRKRHTGITCRCGVFWHAGLIPSGGNNRNMGSDLHLL